MKIRNAHPNFHSIVKIMVDRPSHLKQSGTALKRSPVAARLEPRPCAKTILSSMLGQGREATYFDLESPPDLQRLPNPVRMLGSLSGTVIMADLQQLKK